MKNSHEDTKARRVNQNPEHSKQVLAYLRLLKLPLGLVINFGAPRFKEDYSLDLDEIEAELANEQ